MTIDPRPERLANGDLEAQLDRVRLESDTLYAVIAAIASGPDLDRVLGAIVDLLTQATGCHACFVYLRDGSRLRIRAASRVYAHVVGRVEFGVDEGLAGWAARHRQPAFIRDHALDDPRMKYVAELEEERFQSMAAVPVLGRSGDVIGVVVLHTVAPREFDEGAMNFLVHTASLVAGAIENARLYEQARRRVDALTMLSALSQRIAAVTRREDLYRVVTSGVRDLLACDACQLFLFDAEDDRLELAASEPGDSTPALREGTAALLDLLRDRGEAGHRHAARAPGDGEEASPSLAAPLTVGDAHVGVLVATGHRGSPDDEEMLRAVANQVALALRQAELIERLTEENIVRDLFEALAAGSVDVAFARARAARVDLSRPHVLIHVEPAPGDTEQRAWPDLAERTEARLRRLAPGAVCDAQRDSLRGLLPLSAEATDRELELLDGALRELGSTERVLIGRSTVHRGGAHGRRNLREAADAARIGRALLPAGGALTYGTLGAYKYLVRLPLEDAPEDRQAAAVQRLMQYDGRRHSQLVQTLEQYLRDRRSIATTARALYIHPNTLRQRLARIEKLSGLDLATEDLLSLELALKLVRLRASATVDE